MFILKHCTNNCFIFIMWFVFLALCIRWGSESHNACKCHGFLDTGFKQTGPSPLPPRYPNEIKN